MSEVTKADIDREVAAIGEVVRVVGGLKTQAERFRVLTYAVDSFMGRPLAEALWRACSTAERERCAEHNLLGCRTCWPERAP